MNIILIGMPASGKTTVGKRLAEELNFNFIDTDKLLPPIPIIIELMGENFFLQWEEEKIMSIECNKTVIATGGSVVLSDKSMAYLKSIGSIIYLDMPLNKIKSRIGNLKKRGVVGGSLDSIYSKRTPLYKKYCDFSIVA